MSIEYTSFKERCTEDIERRFKSFPKDWPLERLIELQSFVSTLLRNSKNRIMPNWDIFISTVAETIQDEDEYEKFWSWWKRTVLPLTNEARKQGKFPRVSELMEKVF